MAYSFTSTVKHKQTCTHCIILYDSNWSLLYLMYFDVLKRPYLQSTVKVSQENNYFIHFIVIYDEFYLFFIPQHILLINKSLSFLRILVAWCDKCVKSCIMCNNSYM